MRRFGTMSAALFAVLAACGDDGNVNRLPDAPPLPDAGPATGKVNVTALARHHEDVPAKTPRRDVHVFSLKQDGSLAGSAMTGEDGKATVEVEEGGTVTVVYPESPSSGRRSIASYVGVKPYDELTFGDAYTDHVATPGESGAMQVSWAAFANASYYHVHTPCSGYMYTTGTTRSIDLYEWCQVPTAPIAVVAHDDNGRALASAYVAAAPFTPGATLALEANQWTAQPADNFRVTVSGLEPAHYNVELRGIADYGRFTIEDHGYPPTDSGTATTAMSLPATAPATSTSAHLRRGGFEGRQYFHKRGASPLALSVAGLPWIAGVIASPATRQILWLQGAGAHDAAVLWMRWYRYDGKSSTDYEWTAIIAPDRRHLSLEGLPSALAEHLPKPDEDASFDFALVDLSSTTDYDGVRALPEWRTTDPASAVRDGDEPSAAISEYDGGEGFAAFR